MWQRWNQTTHIFEKSDNDGATWIPLPLSGATITEGIIPNVAYKNVANIFTENQTIQRANEVSLKLIDSAKPVDGRQFNVTNFNSTLYLNAVNDAQTVSQGEFRLARNGLVGTSNTFLEYNRTNAVGHWTWVPFNAANFSSLGGAWTVTSGDVYENRYCIIGKTAIYSLVINNSTTTGAPTQIYVNNPVPNAKGFNIAFCRMGISELITAYTNNGDPKIYMIRPAYPTGFPATTGSIWFTMIMEVSS